MACKITNIPNPNMKNIIINLFLTLIFITISFLMWYIPNTHILGEALGNGNYVELWDDLNSYMFYLSVIGAIISLVPYANCGSVYIGVSVGQLAFLIYVDASSQFIMVGYATVLLASSISILTFLIFRFLKNKIKLLLSN